MAKAATTKAAVQKPAPKPPVPASPSLRVISFPKGNLKNAVSSSGAISKTMYMVGLDQIKVLPGFNLRVANADYAQSIQELGQSIRREGFLADKPLSVMAGQDDGGADVFFLVDGHRRLEAVRVANEHGAAIERIPVVVRPGDPSALDLSVHVQTANSGATHTMLERAILVKRMLTDGQTAEEVADRLGITLRYVNDLKLLIEAPKAIRRLVQEGMITGTVAVKELRKSPDEAAAKLTAIAEKAKAKGEKRVRQGAVTQGAQADIKMRTVKHSLMLSVGEKIALSAVAPFLPLLGDQDWFVTGEEEGTIEALEPVQVTVAVKRVRKDAEAEAQPVATETPPVGKGKGRKARRIIDAMVDENEDEGDDGDEDADMPDLRQSGLADPVENAGL